MVGPDQLRDFNQNTETLIKTNKIADGTFVRVIEPSAKPIQ
jgi:hypothetical protein